jgi:phosphoglycerate dehydrogenase-like enzyme
MPVTVLYPEERQIPDDDLERLIFGPEMRIIRRPAKTLSDLDPADCAEVDGLMIMRYTVTPEDLGCFPRLRAIVRMGVGYDRIGRPRRRAISSSAMCRITARPRSPTTPWRWRSHCAAV